MAYSFSELGRQLDKRIDIKLSSENSDSDSLDIGAEVREDIEEAIDDVADELSPFREYFTYAGFGLLGVGGVYGLYEGLISKPSHPLSPYVLIVGGIVAAVSIYLIKHGEK